MTQTFGMPLAIRIRIIFAADAWRERHIFEEAECALLSKKPDKFPAVSCQIDPQPSYPIVPS
jgi:hypothetical protein